ncbi:RNase H domain-containing protein [Hirsutella rhossiliensis]|uniref:RNase H domain-containing protein n=1 Tax=Hirsutella rhossiliensis TaxID=111463 RepID=A0A9P8MR45_9HYPO|nr:RNase H domain-containing protein [Hirsutella rhossiliensis]KAH0959755.1 RNase H domain-containing protein [Hirsutella rhossiliensis]
MDDVLGEDIEDNEEDDEDHDVAPFAPPSTIAIPSLGSDVMRGTGLVFPSKFRHPTSPLRPMELFRGRVRFMNIVRCTYPNDKSMLLIMTDGACLNNGQSNPKAAVIAALRFRHWPGEGFSTVIIATDSEYVVEGSTQWAKAWVQNNWRTKGKKGIGGGNVKNKDLWEMLLGECEKAHRNGLVIQFWKIPRQWNALADEGAKNAAAAEETPVEWKDCLGLAI